MRQLVDRMGVIGMGVVGKATARAWLEFAGEVRCYDAVPERSSHALSEVLGCDWIQVCLPTNFCPVHGISLAVVDAFFNDHSLPRNRRYVLRSTVLPGTTDRLCSLGYEALTYMPEFLTGRCSEVDAMVPPQLVVGMGTHDKDDYCESRRAAGELQQLLIQRFPGTRNLVVKARDAEFAKLALNGFFAVKVLYFNHLHEACTKLGIHYDYLRRILLGDGRIAGYHTEVPGRDGKLGLNAEPAACLPKDCTALARLLDELKLPSYIPTAAMAYNAELRY